MTSENFIHNLGAAQYTIHPLNFIESYASSYFTHSIDKIDLVGNIKEMTRNRAKHTFTYDDLDQLISETGPYTHTYLFDSHNSRLQKDTANYEVNDLHELLSTPSDKFTYDDNGNPKTHNATTLTYDALDSTCSRVTIQNP